MADEIHAALAAASPPASRRVFCPIWRNPWMSFNRDTYAHDVLLRAGGENVCAAESERYPNVDIDAILAAAPEVILLPDEPYRFAERHRQELRALIDSARIHLVDGKALSWYGPRTAAAVKYFREKLKD